MSKKLFTKDPSDVLDYVWDWTDFLGSTDTIQSFSFELPTELTEVTSGEVDGKVTLWVSGGTLDETYPVSCTIVTAEGRTKKRTAIFMMDDE